MRDYVLPKQSFRRARGALRRIGARVRICLCQWHVGSLTKTRAGILTFGDEKVPSLHCVQCGGGGVTGAVIDGEVNDCPQAERPVDTYKSLSKQYILFYAIALHIFDTQHCSVEILVCFFRCASLRRSPEIGAVCRQTWCEKRNAN
jgi:hypothetical protein